MIITGAVLEKVKQLAEPPSDYGLLERIKNAGNALMGTPSQKESAADDVVTIRFDCYGNSKQTAAVNAKLVAIRNE